MRSKHPSDQSFETWVTSGGGEDKLRTHVVQAGFREGWNAGAEPWRQIAERLAFQLSDALHVLKTQAGISDLRSEQGGSAERVLADYLAMLPPDQRPTPTTERGVVVPLKRRS